MNTSNESTQELPTEPVQKKKRGRQPKYKTDEERATAKRAAMRNANARRIQAMTPEERAAFTKKSNESKIKWYYNNQEQAHASSVKMHRRNANAYRTICTCDALISNGASFDEIKQAIKSFKSTHESMNKTL